MIVEKTGDVFTSDAEIIAHGCNTSGVMGKGVAVEFKRRYPDMYQQYRNLCLGNHMHPGQWYGYKTDDGIWIANMMTQDKPGPNARYEWVVKCLESVIEFAEENNISKIATVRLGCGIGGLTWRDMYYELVSNFEESPITIEVWSL